MNEKNGDPIRLDTFYITHRSILPQLTVAFSLQIYTTLEGSIATEVIPQENTSCKMIQIRVQNTSLDSYHFWEQMERTGVLEKIHEHLKEKRNVWMEWHHEEQCGASLLACYLVKYCDMSSVEATRWIRGQDPALFVEDGIHFISAIEKIEEEKFSMSGPFSCSDEKN